MRVGACGGERENELKCPTEERVKKKRQDAVSVVGVEIDVSCWVG